jgi:competence protein ComEC
VKKLVLLLLALASASARSQGLSISFLDVGQGDAALIRSPTGRNVLIDAGPSPTRVADWLRRERIDTIHLAIASHNHADHIGGMPRVIETLPVRNYMENGMPATTRTYARIVTLLEERGIPVLRATARVIDIGGGASLRVLATVADPGSQNDGSIGVDLAYGSFHALFTGDAEGQQRAFWSRDSAAVRCHGRSEARACRLEVLKVSHHGSANGTDAAWLAALHPCLAVISVGAKNSFHHPSGQVLRLLAAAGARTYRTDLNGQVDVVADTSGGFAVKTRNGTSAFPSSCQPAR